MVHALIVRLRDRDDNDMNFFYSIAFNPGMILTCIIPQIFCVIYGSPHAIFKASSTDIDALEHSKSFFRSWRALVCPLIMWIGMFVGSGVVDWLRQSDPIGHLWAYGLLIVSSMGLGLFLGWKAETRLIRIFMRRFNTETNQANKTLVATGDNVLL